jgi:hypothetical protein
LTSIVQAKTALAFAAAQQTHSAVTPAEQCDKRRRKACPHAWSKSSAAGPATHSRALQTK